MMSGTVAVTVGKIVFAISNEIQLLCRYCGLGTEASENALLMTTVSRQQHV